MIYFRNSFLVTVVGLALGAYLGWRSSHSWTGALSTMFIVAVLATLEVSLSFDNAVVNAAVLRKMSPLWRSRFITWGIAIVVFGMRIVFPLVIVAIIARIGRVSALVLAATEPDNYSRVLPGFRRLAALSRPWSDSATFSTGRKACIGSLSLTAL